ncbi:MAG TPA: LPS assembly lipoprotein LptE [Methylomirabilota bacterium]|jgi:outer membrane lipopolysaccharide assembly protein LptE/RlpB|nr:LPS assembly lipoprotein LptE [Methylomirabilota bacterium]
MRRACRLSGAVAVVLALLGAGGCGYSLRSGGNLPSSIQTVHIPVLENKTREPGIEDFITQALTQAVVTAGRLKIAANAASADAVLEGSIIGYSLTSLSFDSSANVTRYRLQIALALTLRDRQKNEVIWRQDRIEERADFPVSGQVTVNLVREQDAVKRAAVDVSRAIVSLAFEGF